MPYINVKTPFKVNEKEAEKLKSELAKVMLETAGKPENWLMIGFGEENLYFKGIKCDKAALVEVKLVGTLNSSQKTSLSNGICNVLSTEIGVPSDKTYIVMTEVDGENWGWNGSTF
jgi:phenylpyruvate tautomerase